MASNRLKGGRTDKVSAGFGKHDINPSTRLDEQTRQLSRLVGRHTAGHAKNNPFSC
jgi:hypothetical protein